jgi:hypothetical protein
MLGGGGLDRVDLFLPMSWKRDLGQAAGTLDLGELDI